MTKMCLVMALIHNVELKIYNKNYPFLSLAKETSAYLTLITLQTVLLMFTKCSCQFFFFWLWFFLASYEQPNSKSYITISFGINSEICDKGHGLL